MSIRHKTFLSYHHDDNAEVERFISAFDDTHSSLITRGIRTPEDLIDSENPEYVMGEIRRRYLADSTVTIVLVGARTSTRRFVDWEVQSSLRQPQNGYPNGLLAILLDKNSTRGTLPDRVTQNYESGYAKFYSYPSSPDELARWIDEAYDKRFSSAHLIKNPRDRMKYNRT